jgi:hypothetical protein
MCLLIHHTPETQFDIEHLRDFYSRNSDGFGAMVSKPDGVKIIKTVGNLDEINELYNNEIKGFEAVIHFRMQTHGDIDLFNCHPYQVTDNLWMAHNGILSTGNKDDVTKSDTWHYIQNFLKPLLARDPHLIHEPSFQKLIESHIGYTNKFGFMDGDGKVVIVNRQAGVQHFNAWLSNTYAWSPSKWNYFTDTYNRQPSTYQSTYGQSFWDKDASVYNSQTNTWSKSPPQLTKKEKKAKRKKSKDSSELNRPIKEVDQLSTESLGRIIRSCYNAMQRNPQSGILDWVIMHPMKAQHLIWEFYPDMYNPHQIGDIVNSDPDEAAGIIEAAWYECEEDMLAIAKIPFSPQQGVLI